MFCNIDVEMAFIRAPKKKKKKVKDRKKKPMCRAHDLERNGSSRREMRCDTDI